MTLEEKATTQQNNNKQNQNKQNQNKQNQSKGTRISCGTAAQAQEQGAQQQLSKGFAQGFADTKKACTAKAPQQGLAPLDPNFEKGYKQGSDAAINSKFCQDKLNQ
ncbi:hypothetical protein ACIRP0_04450 [Streptomyces sp. NPDC101733]|uniref:hypothetical protein n=1 Tax=unclassified Streptomyces TaxID=2593676 RepID=UPI003823EACF